MIMYTNTSMVHMGIITHHSPLYEGNDQVAMAIQTFIIPLHSFNTSNYHRLFSSACRPPIITQLLYKSKKYIVYLRLIQTHHTADVYSHTLLVSDSVSQLSELTTQLLSSASTAVLDVCYKLVTNSLKG